MNPELVRDWLQLGPGEWPPDHYRLLGLEPGTSDLEAIERAVQERMAKVRQFQLPHPEAATEAMNRLAQALVCLTDSHAKELYDTQLLAREETPERPPSPDIAPPPSDTLDPLAWLFGPWNTSLRTSLAPPGGATIVDDWRQAPPPARNGSSEMDSGMAALPEPMEEASGRQSPREAAATLGATPGVGVTLPRARFTSRRALYHEIGWTRQLLFAWDQAGKYLGQPTRMVTKPSEAIVLIRHMKRIRDLLKTTALLGAAGQPGYLVLALARQQMIVPTLQALLPSQREALNRDWQTGQGLLLGQRKSLREELRRLKQRNSWLHGFKVLGRGLIRHPGWIVMVLALVTVNIQYRAFLRELVPYEIGAFFAILAFLVFGRWRSHRPVKPEAVPSRPPVRASARRLVRLNRRPGSSRA
jgi:hypothetical protein